PGPGGDVEDVAVEDVEHAQPDFAPHHLLLVGDHVHHLERAGVDQAQVQAEVNHEEARGRGALEVLGIQVAPGGGDAGRTDVEVERGDAARHIEVGAWHLARQDAAVFGRRVRGGGRLVGDKPVVGVF